MLNPKKRLEKEIKENLNNDLAFDVSTLSTNQKRGFSKYRTNKIIRNTVIATLCSCILIIVIIPILMMLKVNSNPRVIAKRYDQSELNNIEENSFKKLNDITYPNGSKKQVNVSDDYKEAVNNFAYNIYNNLKNKEENQIFSPLSLYSLLDIMSLGTTSSEMISAFDTLLGVNSSTRKVNFSKMYENNHYYNDDGTLQMYNGLFLYDDYDYNIDHLNEISNKYCEAFQMDFTKQEDINKMIKWINTKVQDDNFINSNELDFSSLDAMYYFSTMLFDNKWYTQFSKDNTKKDNFYITKDNYKKVDFMSHKYFGEVYDYDSYYAFYDYYKNGSKVKYYVSKELDDNIFDLIDFSSASFLKDEQDKRVLNYYDSDPVIDLSIPKFSYTNLTDFSSILKDLGLEKLFSSSYNSLDNVFIDYEDNNYYCKWVKQKNEVTFSEDGTTIKTVSMSFGAGSSAPMESLKVSLNRPFVYVIYDSNDLPLYIGNVIDPSLK